MKISSFTNFSQTIGLKGLKFSGFNGFDGAYPGVIIRKFGEDRIKALPVALFNFFKIS